MSRRVVLLGAAAGAAIAGRPVLAQQGVPAFATTTATLTVLAGSVHRIPAVGGPPQPAVDGQSLATGDRIVTGPNDSALVTFLDGSTLAITRDTDVVVRRADVGAGRSASRVNIHINLGAVWARVVRLADPSASFSLESSVATATVHDGLIGGWVLPDGVFACWTRAGDMHLTDLAGRPLLTLRAEEVTFVTGGEPPSALPFPPVNAQSLLRVTAPGHVLPLVGIPKQTTLLANGVAGFVTPGIEISQVPGSFVGVLAGERVAEVPAWRPGTHPLVLEGLHDGPFTVSLTATWQGERAFQHQVSGTIRRGERLLTHAVAEIDSATLNEPNGLTPSAARIVGLSVQPLVTLRGPLPAKIVLSPSEVRAVAGVRFPATGFKHADHDYADDDER